MPGTGACDTGAMSSSLVLTVIGKDRPGLVEAISQVVSDHEANWEASHMARIGGRFAGILQVSVAEGRAQSLAQSLEKLGPSGLRVIVEDSVEGSEPAGQAYWIELVGSDQPNIVRDISKALASREVTVLELSSEISEAPVAGGRLFKLQASIRCPASLSKEDLRESLEELANSLMVDLQLTD
jgi:glycine cleavage system regulatory protein